MIDYGGGLIFPDSWAYGPPDPPEGPEEDEDVEREMIGRLAIAVRGDDAVPVDPDEYNLDDLLYEVGEMRRQIASAHMGLDLMELPRRRGEWTLTLRGRIDELRG